MFEEFVEQLECYGFDDSWDGGEYYGAHWDGGGIGGEHDESWG
jgi:hypothetical protein